MKNIILTALFFICCLVNTEGQVAAPSGLTTGIPEKSGASKEAFERMDKIVQQYVDSQWIAGATLIVAKNGSIIYHSAIGYSDKESRTKMKKDNIFRIASQTKAVTCVGIMVLLEQGKILLDDPVEKYIPSFRDKGVIDKYNEADTSYTTIPVKRSVTIRDLMTHTSGVGYAQIGSPQFVAIAAKAGVIAGLGVPNLTVSDQGERIAKLPLESQPGEKWSYGLNMDLLGYLIERVSKQPLDKFFRQYILDPLGMEDTWFYLPNDRRKRLVTLYEEDSTGHVKKPGKNPEFAGVKIDTDYPNAKNGTMFAGGAGLSSTAYDYAVFMQMLLNGGTYNGKKIISQNSVRLMSTNQIGDINFGDEKFGLGFGLTTEKSWMKFGIPAGSFEWGGAFSSSYWIDPVNKIVAQLFINQLPNSHGDIHDKFKMQVYSSLVN